MRDRDNDLDVVGDRLRFELGLGLHQVLDLGAGEVFNNAVCPDEGLDVGVKAVGHQVELTIRWDKRDVALLLEFVQADALVEFDVLHFDQFAAGRPALHIEEDFVVQA